MGTWMDAAQAVLAAASATVVTPADPDAEPPVLEVQLGAVVAREFVAPGPDFARDCSLLAVHVGSLQPVQLAGADADLGMLGCVIVPAVQLVVTLALDCVPAPSDSGKPPPVAAVTAWSVDFYDKASALWQHLADVVTAGGLEGCDDTSLGTAFTAGPQGGMAQVQIPVRVRLDA